MVHPLTNNNIETHNINLQRQTKVSKYSFGEAASFHHDR